jgi:DNA helicase-2/ATP-dependent DNA helicase PcrA
MRERLEKLLGADVVRDLWVGTFHATCARILRRWHDAAGLGRDFVIYDDADQRAVVSRVLKELDLDEKRWPVRMVLSRIHREKQEGRKPGVAAPVDYVDDKLVELYQRYEKHLSDANAVDFEDLILKVSDLAESESAAGEELRRRFRYVLVDEFQDTNRIQYRLVRQLVSGHGNLCVVGDDDQSIYRWRGADIRNIRGFRHDFPGAEVIKLEQNYRSTGRIVRAALGVIQPSRDREPKELWTANDDGHKVRVVASADERDEAAYVVERVREHMAAGVSAKDIAVFYRIHAQSRVLEEAMRVENVPYQIVGGTKFFDRAEVKDLLSYLRITANPRSDVDLVRIINVPARGIGTTTIDRLTAMADDLGTCLYDAIPAALESPELGSAAKKKLAGFRNLIDGFAREAASVSPSILADMVLEQTGYRAGLQREDTAESDARLENLAELLGSIVEYEQEAHDAGESSSLAGYLERVTLASDVDQMKDVPRVAMMTIHSAKGLEFRTVLLTGMEDEVFPYKGLTPGEEEELEEERRLAYVALTRARERLFITHASVRTLFGQTRYGRPSQFIKDLPASDIEHVSTSRGRTPNGRFVDRQGWGQFRGYGGHGAADARVSSGSYGEGRRAPEGEYEREWRHPQEAPAAPLRAVPSARSEGERYVDRSAFDDVDPSSAEDGALRRGARVRHARFGTGEVRRIEKATELMVVAFFPGWGEKKILARFLERAE